MRRHFAFFRQGSGEWVREAYVPVAYLWLLRLSRFFHAKWLANFWATMISQPESGEVGLDVTHLRFPFGDLVWAKFDDIDRVLSFPEPHHILTVRVADGFIVGNVITGRPVRFIHPDYFVFDITGSKLIDNGRYLHGYLRFHEGVVFVSQTASLQLEEASPLLKLHALESEKVAVCQ